ncbi:MAG TPA: hypothetical protein VF092_31010 [Longimicrobium sp.]
MGTSREHFERAREMIEKYRPDPARLEEMRKKTLLALLVANDIHLPNADQLDSVALRKVLHAATNFDSPAYLNGR